MIVPAKVASVAVVAVLALASAAIAGFPVQLLSKAPEEAKSAKVLHPVWDGVYSFAPSLLTDGKGNVLDSIPGFEGANAPHAVERLLDLGGAEPNIGVTSKGNIFVTSADQVRRSSDQGRTWQTVYNFVTPFYPTMQDRYSNVDPMLWVDPLTDRVFVSYLTLANLQVTNIIYCTDIAYSDDEGQTWKVKSMAAESQPLRNLACDTTYFLDHQKIMTAPPRPVAGVAPPMTKYPNVFYFCSNKFVSTFCAVSLDGGDTFAYTRPVIDGDNDYPIVQNAVCTFAVCPQALEPTCTGINGHPAAYPDGTVVVPICSAGSEGYNPMVGVTEDNGLTWQVREAPPSQVGDLGQVEIDPDITVTPDGTAYMLMRSAKDQLAYLLRSRDKFVTWEGPFKVSLPGHTLAAFAGITSGGNGRIALAYLGTSTDQRNERDEVLAGDEKPVYEPSFAKPGTLWHLYLATSLDADSENPTFHTQQVTPAQDPVQVGCIWYYGGSGGPRGCRNMLDFIDMVSDREGRTYVAFTDGCTPRNGCTTDIESASYQSRDREIAVAIQVSGVSLLAETGLVATIEGFEHPRPVRGA